jgi:predicted ribonuclease toxin of YeeF-YezG toxin-antitoxin module
MTNIFSLGSPEKTQATKVMVEYASAVPVSEEESPSLKSRKRPFATLTNDEQDVAKEHERSSPLKSTYTYDDFLMEEKNASEQDTGKRNRENQVVSSDEDLNIKETSVKVTYQNDLSPNSQQRTQDLKTLRKQEKTPPSPKKYVYLSKLYPSDFSGYDHDEQEKHTYAYL